MATTYQVAINIQANGHQNASRSIRGVSDEVKTLKALLGTYISTATLWQTLRLADTYGTLLNRLRVVSDNQWQVNRAMQAMYDISLDTRSSLASNVEMYARAAINTKQLGIEQERLIGFTKSLRQAMALSGVTAREADWGMIQLSQGMSAGALRGDELRSVMEQLPVVADVLAKSMGVTRGELRYLAFQSKVTTQVMIKAFEDAREELEERFAKRIPTVGEGWAVLGAAALKYVGDTDQAVGVTRTLASAMQGAARHASVLGPAILGVGAGLVVLVSKLTIVKALLAVGPAGWIVAGIAAAATAVVALIAHWDQFRLGIAIARDKLEALGIPIDAFLNKLEAFGKKWVQIVTSVPDSLNLGKQLFNLQQRARAMVANDPMLSSLATKPSTAGGYYGAATPTSKPAAGGMGPHEAAVRAEIAAKQAAQKTQEILNKAWQPTVEQQAWFAQLQRPLDDYMNRLDAIEGFTAQVTRTQEIYTQQLLEGKISHMEYNQLMGEAETKLRTLKQATDELIKSTNDNAEANRQCYADGLKSLESYQRASAELWLRATDSATDYQTGIARGFTELWLQATNNAQMMQDFVGNTFKGMEDMVVDFVTKGKVDFKSFVDSVLADLTRMLYRQMMAKAFSSLASAWGGGPGGMATGGSPTVNQPVWVGERGPEIFKPAQAGTIVPNQQAAPAAAPSNVTVINVDSMDKALAAMRSTEGQRIIINSK